MSYLARLEHKPNRTSETLLLYCRRARIGRLHNGVLLSPLPLGEPSLCPLSLRERGLIRLLPEGGGANSALPEGEGIFNLRTFVSPLPGLATLSLIRYNGCCICRVLRRFTVER